MRALPIVLALLLTLTGGSARADVVGPCPPGFQPSHSGCHFGPGPDDLVVCAGCACVLVGLGSLSALLLWRKRRESGPREGAP